MYKLEKKEIKGLSPFYIKNAEKDKILLEIQGNHKQEATETAENIFDGILELGEWHYSTGKKASASDRMRSTDYMDIEGQTKVSILKKNGGKFGFALRFYDADKNYIGRVSNQAVTDGINTSINNNLDPTKTVKYMTLTILNSTDTSEIFGVNKGLDLEWHDFIPNSPSLEYPSEIETVKDNIKVIQSNKNLFKLNDSNLNGVELTNLEDGSYKLNGTSLKSWVFQKGEPFIISKGIYVISTEGLEGVTSAIFGIKTEDNSFKQEISIATTYRSFEIEKNMKVIPFFTCSSGTVYDNVIAKVQLEKSSVKTEWIKHEEKEYNLPIQKEMLQNDKFDLLKNKEIHIWKKLILNGTENWKQSSTVSSVFYLNMQDTTQDKTKFKLISNQYLFKGILENSVTSAENNKIYGFISEGILRQRILLRNDNFTTLDSFKASLAEKNMTLYYVSDTTTELDLTEEQKQILDSIETFDGVNNIFFDNSIAKATIKYTPKLTDEIKKAFTESAVYSEIKLEDGKILTESDYIKSVKFYDTKFVPDNGIIGQAVMKQVDLQINNENQDLQLEDKEYELFLSTYYNEEKYSIKYGKFIIQKIEDENTTDNNELTSFDYMVKSNQEYIDQMQYPCTLRALAQNICEQLGLVLQKEKFRNENFIVENNQFVENEKYRDVLKAIAMSAFSWVRIDENNILRFDFNPNVDIAEELDYDDYYNLNKNEKIYGPVNRIVLQDSQIKGENVTIQDEESISKNGLHELVISDNPFAYTEEKRTQLINAGKELYGFEYFPINSMNTKGFIWLNCTDKIRIKNMQDKFIDTFVFDHTIEYEGTAQDEIASPALTETETKYIYTPEMQQKIQRTERIVDKQNQTITDIVTKTDENTEKISEHTQTLDTIRDTLESITTTVSKTVKEVKVLYALSNSQTEPPTEGWSVVAPEWQANKYMWQKTVTIFSDDTQEESQPTNIQGAKGQDGTDGKNGTNGINGTDGKDGLGIKSIQTQYYLSTSETELVGGTWKETQDKWTKGKYIWTRSKITWSDNSVTYSTAIVAEGLNTANENADSANEGTKETITKVSEVEKTVEGISQTVTETTEKLNNDYSTTEETKGMIKTESNNINLSVTKKIDNIQVGGTNLIENSAPYNLDNWEISNSNSIELTLKDEETAPYKKCLRIRTLNVPSIICGIRIVVAPKVLEANKEYCFSLWLKATAATKVTAGYEQGGKNDFNVTTEWQKFESRFIASNPQTTEHRFVIYLPIGTTAGRSVYVHSIKLEEGNKITAWSPAPSDDVKGFEVGTKIEQNVKSVQIAWNQLSQSIKFEGDNNDATIAFYDGDKKFGEMGANTVDNNRYISFATFLDYGQNISDGMAWGIQTISDNKFLPILFLKDFFMANKNAGNFGGQLVLNFCDFVLGTGAIKAENIRVGADDTAKGIYFEDTESGDILMGVYPDSNIGLAQIMFLDAIKFGKNKNGSNSLWLGNDNVLTDDGSIIANDITATKSLTSYGGIFDRGNLKVYGGDINLGSTTDSEKVSFTLNLKSMAHIGGNVTVSGRIYANNISSDRRLKDKIKDSNTNALDLISKIKHRQFEMKKDKKHYEIGYIAQELEEIDKNFVLIREKDEKEDEQYYVNELPILATATKAIQEIEEDRKKDKIIIEEMQNQIEQMKKEIAELKKNK